MRILVSAGEYSGDLYASRMITALRDRLNEPVVAFGMGGPELRKADTEIFFDYSQLQTHGLVEAIPQLTRLMRAFKTLVQLAEARRPDCALLVDFPDFHLRLARSLKKLGIPVIQFVAPTVWAWREQRIHTIKRYVDKLLVIYPFEEPLFRHYGIDAEFIGHPLMDLVRVSQSRESFLGSCGWDEPVRVIGLMPGSRPREVRSLLPAMLETCKILSSKQDNFRFFLVPAPTVSQAIFQNIISRYPLDSLLHVLPDEKYDAMANADLLLVASGTAALEAMLVRTPAIVLYRVNPLTAWIARRVLKVSHVSMVNILAQKTVQPEFLQSDIKPEAIADEILHILESPERLKAIFDAYFNLMDDLGCLHAFEEGPRVIFDFLQKKGIIKSKAPGFSENA